MSKGTLFVLTGPSGVGKGTIISRVFSTTDRLFYSVSVTTRRPRQGEEHGINYHFYDRVRVEDMLAKGQLLEHAEYAGSMYGTPAAPVEEKLGEGLDVILEIEVQGALKVKEKRPDAVMVFIVPPSFEELERRLRGRGTESDEAVARRMARAREEYRHIGEFKYVVTNQDVEDAADRIRAIIIASRCETHRLCKNVYNA